MSKIVDDIRSGLKGIRGAGEVARGEANAAADHAFDNEHKHAANQQSELRHQAVADKGRRDINQADEMVARHEWKHEQQRNGANRNGGAGVGAAGSGTAAAANSAAVGSGAPSAGGIHTGQYGTGPLV
ncbi:hypothetical protein BX600DRAFT_552538 [Xylariales sp. PMI_506]|nr:hypothetical protein BX600DRAFT_552538 [Xylariales sp. PMI_506]